VVKGVSRTRRAVTALVAGGFLVTACTQAPPGAEQKPAEQTQAPLRDTIVVGMSQEPDTLFFPIGNMYVATVVSSAINKNLTERNDKNEYIPRLAEKTPTIDNGGAQLTKTSDGKDQLTVTYKLRDGVKFQNGDPVTSEDVKYSWQLNQNKDVPVVGRSTGARYQTINTPDPKTVEVVYKPGELDPVYFSFCCTIVSKKLFSTKDLKNIKTDPFGRTPIYTGPYQVKSWDAGSAITVEAVPDHWMGKQKTKTIIFKFVTDANTLLAQVRTGQVDVVTEDALTLDQIPELDKLPTEAGVTPYYMPSATWEHLDFNLRDPKDGAVSGAKPHPILSDKRVRQAIAHGINREAMTKQILFGKTKQLNSIYFPPSWAAASDSDVTVYNYDQAKAKALLDEAGWKVGGDGFREKDGKKLELKMQSTNAAIRAQTTQVMGNDLKAIGIKVNIDLMVSTKFFAASGDGPLYSGTYDLGLFAWVGGDDPLSFIYLCTEIPTKQNNYTGSNTPAYCNKDFDTAVNAANNSLKQEERKPLYVQAQKIITGDLPILPLYQRLNQSLAKTKLKNFKPAPTNTPPTWNANEWELPQ
jgi:peptide/nickel transport system substrate-binding protein